MFRATLLCMFFALGSLQSITAQTGTAQVDVSKIVENNNRFALELYNELRSSEGNLFYSPSSIMLALSMTYAGARGETESEMAKTLHLPIPMEGLHEQMKALQASYVQPNKESHIQLRLANRLWGAKTYEFLPEFLQVTRENYGAELSRLDFSQGEDARQTINRWVEDQTEERISDLIPPQLITSATKLVLTNAIYFYGDWTKAFDETLTEPADFRVNASDKVVVSMMFRQDRLRYWYSEADDLQILELPYGDGSFSMVVLLPGKLDGLADLERKLTFQNLQRWKEDLTHNREVLVYLPKFTAISEFDLVKQLRTMGMVSAFDPSQADFSGMTTEGQLAISNVIHKAFVEVGEKGTEATAATAVLLEVAGPADGDFIPATPVFRADHPFLFLIRDNRNDAIQFIGRMTDPPAYERAGQRDVIQRVRSTKQTRGNITGKIDTRSTLRGTLTLSPAQPEVIPAGGKIEIGSAKPRFDFKNVPDAVYELHFRGTKDGTTTPLTWKGLELDRPGEQRALELSDAD